MVGEILDFGSLKMDEVVQQKKLIGFAALSPERRKEIAAKGGRNVPAHKRTFSNNKALASNAGIKGGRSVDPKKRPFSTNKALAVEAGRKGNKASRKSRKEHKENEALYRL